METATKYEDVKKVTTEEYFKNNQFSIDAFKKKYSLTPDEGYVQAVKRVCDFVASVEPTQELRDYWSARWFDEIYNDWWHPAGSIMQGAGSGRKISLANCFSRNTEFITDQGVRTFEWFNDNQEIKVMNNYGAFVPAIVKNFGRQKLYKITLGRHTLKKDVYCTSGHVWRTLDGETIVEKSTMDLSPHDVLPYIKRKWMAVKKTGSRYYCPIGFIHGYVYGDGDYDKSTNTCRLHLCGDSKELVGLFSGFNWSIKETEEAITIQYLPSHFKQEIPDFDKYNEEYILGFLIGYFAADGSVDEHGRAYLSCAHDDILFRVKNIVESVGIYCSDIRLMRNKSPFDDNPSHKLYGMHIWKDCLFDSFFLKTNHKQNWESYKNSLVKDKSKVNWKVISLEETDRVEDVWCVQVPEYHNFTLSGGLNTGNCTTISLGAKRDDEEWDNLESIIKNTAYTIAKCAAYRQGLGVDFSRLRPNGCKVLNSANQSTGAVHWMEFEDKLGYFVGQKGRIPAMLFSISCDHPDVEEFIQVKSDYTKIQNANISVQCTEKFYKAVENDEDWELRFEIPAIKRGDKVYVDVHSIDMSCVKEKETGRYYRTATHDRKKEVFTKTVKACKLMELIAKNMHTNAEPGIQNIDVARKYSNSDALYDPNDEYDSRILSTNACSEQYLSRESLCVLASINCGKFSTKREIYMTQLDKIGHSINRFLDNVNECELVNQTYATPHQALAIKKLRRTGAGLTNIAAWLFQKNLSYGSKEGNEAIEDFMKWYNYWLYVSTEELGLEKGDFGLFNKEKWRNAPFVSRIMKESEKLNAEFKVPVIKGTHARNVTVSSIAPTGTLSLMFRDFVLSYGIEPAFFMYFWKRTRMAGKYEYYFCVPRVIRDAFSDAGIPIPMQSDTVQDTWDGKIGTPIAKFIDEHKSKFKFKESVDISAAEKLELMAKVMKWVDSSISVTYMLPIGSTWKDVYNFVLEAHRKEVKSIAAFPDKKMYGIVSSIPFRELAFKLKDDNVPVHHQNFCDSELKELNISRENISRRDPGYPKRLPSIDADIYVASVKNQKFVIVVGIQNGQPYEIFGGHLNGFGFKFQQKKGKINKIKKGQYALEFDDICIEDFSKQFTPTEQILFRMASMALRHGVPIQFVVEQLQKASADITSMGAAAARCLKKYIKDGTSINGQKCPDCGKELVYLEGCCSCPSCGWSRCS